MRAAMVDNFLPKALFISLTVHTVFICSGFIMHWPAHQRALDRERQVEISYRPQYRKKPVDMREHPVKPVSRLDLQNSLRPRDGAIPMKLAREQVGLANNLIMSRPKPGLLHSGAMAHQVLISPVGSAKINNPAYAAYTEMVRSRIEEKVYDNFNKLEPGDVYLTFAISSDGTLKGFQIIDEKTHASQNLKDSSRKSMREAEFPPFFKGMSLPEYTFNIEIQYQVRD